MTNTWPDHHSSGFVVEFSGIALSYVGASTIRADINSNSCSSETKFSQGSISASFCSPKKFSAHLGRKRFTAVFVCGRIHFRSP
mmetsp:Transcript_8693/g.19517  ORF Transcript_8693/g.19517 Transcript_8693/m.19517 type:complete len:84 (-) Transcript_8693:1458-1709(-)